MYRIARSFAIGTKEFHEGEIITPLDFFGKLHGLDLAPVADYFEPVEIYFARRFLPIFEKMDSLTEKDLAHVGLEPIKQLNVAMLDLLAANKLNDVSAFDMALEKVEMILRQVEAAKTDKSTKAPRTKKVKRSRSIT